jgi:DtxR family transcriptional regulator, Mn-dependent transcriptional regulator
MSIELSALAILGALAITLWPRHGLMARWLHACEFLRRSRGEDALKHILKAEVSGKAVSREALAGALHITGAGLVKLLTELEEKGLLTLEGGKIRLRPTGRELGLHIVRAHRLWESYLADSTGVEEGKWHPLAEKQEHLLSPEAADDLAARLGHPTRDPHGDWIPDKNMPLEPEQETSLNEAAIETPLLIAHIEDEPEVVYRQLLALGIRPGMKAFVLGKSARRIRFWAGGTEHVLAPLLAENISIKPLPEGGTVRDLVEEQYLSMIKLGEVVEVVGLSCVCRNAERRRLLDLGFVPGTHVEIEMISPAGDPTAYRVRGTVVALRRDQARLIRVNTVEAAAA